MLSQRTMLLLYVLGIVAGWVLINPLLAYLLPFLF